MRESHAFALVTNGASCLQREKLVASGLSDYFDVVVVSAEFGAAKPDASIFRHALDQLGSDDKSAVMVGDSLSRDVNGAIAAGLGAVWVNRFGRSRPAERPRLDGGVNAERPAGSPEHNGRDMIEAQLGVP